MSPLKDLLMKNAAAAIGGSMAFAVDPADMLNVNVSFRHRAHFNSAVSSLHAKPTDTPLGELFNEMIAW